MYRLVIGCLLVSIFWVGTGLGDLSLPEHESNSGKTWVLLVAGSKSWTNYRHQADIYHAYQIISRNQIPDENIVVMVYDDLANHSSNPTPGVIISYPGGPNVYEGLLKDYTGSDVNSTNFLNILTGNKAAMRGIGTGKVIESGPDDIIFVNFVGHGTQGALDFPEERLFADDLLDAIKNMKKANRFSKMVMYIEACYSGSLFDNMLPDDINVLVVTSADPRETSLGCFNDPFMKTWLSNVFSTLWMKFAEHWNYLEKSLNQQFSKVRSYTNTSHPQRYGYLDIGAMKLKNILGKRLKFTPKKAPKFHTPLKDVISSSEIPLQLITDRMKAATDPLERKQLKLERANLKQRRRSLNDLFNEIMKNVTGNDEQKINALRTLNKGLNNENFKCYKELYKTFSNYCMNPSKNPYASVHFFKFINMCSVDWLFKEKVKNDIEALCTIKYGPNKPEDIE